MGMKTKLGFLISCLLAFCLLFACACGNAPKTPTGDNPPPDDNPPVPPVETEWDKMTPQQRTVAMLSATDDFGRTFSLSGEKEDDKYVGMFFFTLHGEMPYDEVHDVTEMTDGGADIGKWFTEAAKHPDNTAYYWGKPLWDYYSQRDTWVIRKQLEMLTMAGVDFLFIDVTNAFSDKTFNDAISLLFEDSTYEVMQIVHEYVQAGWDVPRLMFYTNNNGTNGTKNSQCTKPNDDVNVVREIYNKFYKYRDGAYDDVWFAPNGKPMIVMTLESQQILDLAEEDSPNYGLSDYFEFKNTIWPNQAEDQDDLDPDSFPWMEKYFNGVYLKNRGGTVNVSVAQHMNTIRFSDTTRNYGRGYDYATKKNISADSSKGTNYEFLWKQVLDNKNEVNMVTITGWNEWTASKQTGADGKPFLVDGFNEEYSRDIEPTYGDYKDNFYLQTARNIRAFKTGDKFELSYPAASIDVAKFDASAWKDGKVYHDFTGECTARNYRGWVSNPNSPHFVYLTDDSNRNDIDTVTVTHDGDYVYFRITTVENVEPYEANDTGWMNVLISTDASAAGNLFGYNYFVNRSVTDGKSTVCRRTASGDYEVVGEAKLAVEGKVLQVAVPRAALGLSDGEVPSFSFKVCDNITNPDDVLSYYNSGDAAPIGRLGYCYGK